ncbi:MAG: aldo/keto reductase [Clostridiales bacterium]|nr:aldo/keto reductase [Clostridiales bacterium]
MEKRRLGKTNLEVSIVSLGGIPLQGLTQEEATAVVKAAIENGVNFIDTARGYTISEELIGNALDELGMRDKVHLATKSMVRTYEGMKREIELSLKTLKTDFIELYQLHLLKTKEQYDEVMSDHGAYRALLEAKQEGKILNIGYTGHDAKLLEEILDSKLFDTVQFPYNPIEKQGEALFKKANENDMGVICMKPIAGGSFEKGELSIKWIMENSNISVIIPGMDSVVQVEKNTKASETSLTEEERNEVYKIVQDLGTEFCRRCGYCLPCPQGIDIPTMFLFEAYLKRYDLGDWAQDRYSQVENPASKCVKCGICETRCPYNLPIINMMKRVSETFGR